MPLDYASVMAQTCENTVTWTERDAILYALGIGLGSDPLDRRELRFVYEDGLQVFPTFAVILGFAGGPLSELDIDRRYELHGEHAVTLHQAIPPSGTIDAVGRMLGAWDKGEGKGAVFSQEKVLRLKGETAPLATVVTTSFGRAEGGFGGARDGQPLPHRVPERAPDHTLQMATSPAQAVVYRLSGDLNPLHVDPDFAQASGFQQPILHGLCTFAITARAVLQTYGDLDPALLRHHQVRFSAPVFPGETIAVDLWRDGDVVSFEARVENRGVTVIRNGLSRLGPA